MNSKQQWPAWVWVTAVIAVIVFGTLLVVFG